MLRVMLKEIYLSRKILIFTLIIGLFFIVSLTKMTDEGIVTIGGFILMIVFTVVTTSEHNEAKNRGYYLLRTLPIKGYKIVAGKFLTAFLIMLLGVGYIFLILSILHGNNISEITVNSIISNVNITLIFTGIFYVLVYRIGGTKAINLSRVIFFVLFFGPSLIPVIMEKIGFHDNYAELLEKVNISSPYIMLFLSTIIYFLCLTISIRLFKKYKLV